MVSANALIIPELNAPFKLEPVELDQIRPDEVLVQLKASSICATDTKVQSGKFPVPLPAVVGHEGAGVVLEIGANVIDLSIGDHVVLAYNYCGRCRHCERKKMYHCAELAQLNFSGTRSDGTTTISWAGKPVSSCFFGQSSFCNPAVVAAASCVKIDKSLDFAIACSLGCGIQTGSGCIFNLVKPVENEVHNLVIFGMGSVGSAAVMAANVIKKENPGVLQMIIVVDVNDDRLNMAKELGATHLLNPNTTDVREAILNLTENEGPDVSVDCTGVLSVINQMIENMAPGGKAITVGGTPHGQKASVEVHQFISKCGTYTACHQGNAVSREFIPFLGTLYTKGLFPLDRLQRRYKPDEINQALTDMTSGLVFKPVLIWD